MDGGVLLGRTVSVVRDNIFSPLVSQTHNHRSYCRDYTYDISLAFDEVYTQPTGGVRIHIRSDIIPKTNAFFLGTIGWSGIDNAILWSPSKVARY